jgi:tryptophan-rich sensory protein
MDFNVLAFLCTVGCCLISLITAGKSWSKENNQWYKNLNQPNSLYMVKAWSRQIIGVGFYLLFGYVLYHLFVGNDIVSIIIVIVIILLMGLSPVLLFKTKNLKLFFIVSFIFPILAPVLIFFLLQTNLTLAILAMLYPLWLVYDMSYFYRLMKLNKLTEQL